MTHVFVQRFLLPHVSKLHLQAVHLFVVQLFIVVPQSDLVNQLFELFFFVPYQNVIARSIVIFLLLQNVAQMSFNERDLA